MKKITIMITANDDGEVAVKIDVPTEGTHVVVNSAYMIRNILIVTTKENSSLQSMH